MPHRPVTEASCATMGRPNCVAEADITVPRGVKLIA